MTHGLAFRKRSNWRPSAALSTPPLLSSPSFFPQGDVLIVDDDDVGRLQPGAVLDAHFKKAVVGSTPMAGLRR